MGKRGRKSRILAVALMLAVLAALPTSAYAAKRKKPSSGGSLKMREVRVLQVSSRRVTLRWSFNTSASGYEIYMQEPGSPSFVLKKRVGNRKNTAAITGLKNDQTYYFKIRAFVKKGSSYRYGPFSRVVTGKPVSYAVQKEVAAVHPYYYKARMKRSVKSGGTTIPAGKDVIVTLEGGSSAKITYKKKSYTVPKSSYEKRDFITKASKPYSTSVAENFINTKGYQSETNHLIWISTFTQHVYVFEGKQYHWKLLKKSMCATGRMGAETPIGVSQVHAKKPTVWFNQDAGQGGYYGFRILGGYMHSWLYNLNTGQIWSREVYGRPTSGGCVRVTKSFVKWMYDVVQVDSTVVTF